MRAERKFYVIDADTGRKIRRNAWLNPHAAFNAGDLYTDRKPGSDYKVVDDAGNTVSRGSVGKVRRVTRCSFDKPHRPHLGCLGVAAEYVTDWYYKPTRLGWVKSHKAMDLGAA